MNRKRIWLVILLTFVVSLFSFQSLNAQAETVPLYRLYHSDLQVHLYTTDMNEYKVLGTRGWKQEGVAWLTDAHQGVPVYRLYHPGVKRHLYTKDTNEIQVLQTRGWKKEVLAYRSYGDIKIYRLYHKGIKKHLYTKDANEVSILQTRGWKNEGIAFYGMKTSPEDIAKAQEAVAAAQAQVDTTSATLQQATTAKNQAQQAVTAAQAQLDALPVFNQIKLSTAYVNALKLHDTADYGSAVYNQTVEILKREGRQLNQNNQYQVYPSDAKRTTRYDINNLPKEVIAELSNFGAVLINQIRQQTGKTPVTVTNGSVDFADLVTDNYVADNFDIWNAAGHYDVGIARAAQTFFLDNSQDNKNYWENWAGSFVSRYATIGELKRNVYESIKLFMFSQYEWMHAGSIAGTRFSTLTYMHPQAISYLGIDTANLHGKSGFHYLMVSDIDLTPQSTNFSTTPLANPYNIDANALQAQRNQVSATLSQAQDTLNKSHQALTQALQAYQDAQNNLQKAQAYLASLQ